MVENNFSDFKKTLILAERVLSQDFKSAFSFSKKLLISKKNHFIISRF